MRAIPEAATEFVAAHEDCKLESYRDSGGVLTIGVGHVGPEVHAGLRWTRDQCMAALTADLGIARARLYGVVKPEVIASLTENQYGALLSFVFNLGANPGWTLWKKVNARDFDNVPGEMLRFVFVGKTRVQGLVNRRNAEVALWRTGEPNTVDEAPPSSFTRAEATPPGPSGAAPLHQQPPFIAAAASAVLAAPAGIAKVSSVVAPYADKSHYIQHAVELLATAGGAAAVAGVAVLWWQSRQAKQ